MASNLFNKAKAKSTDTKTAKSKDKSHVIPAFESPVEMAEFHAKLVKLATLKEQIDKLEAEIKDADGYVRELGMSEFSNLIERTGKRESSFIMASEQGASVMVVVQDKYKSINEERANYLKETYGEDIVDEATEFKFNNEVLERNQEVISELIETCDKISDKDKETLIVGVTKYSVKKGLIDSIYKVAKDKGVNVTTLLAEVEPQLQLKSPKA
jgi:hypothetical protein